MHESPELAYELDFNRVLTMEFEVGLKLGSGSDRGPEFTSLDGWGCNSTVYYPGASGVHLQSLLPWSIGGAPPEFTDITAYIPRTMGGSTRITRIGLRARFQKGFNDGI